MPNPINNSTSTLHYRYWIFILVVIIITALTIRIGNNTEINQLLSFALTLSSLLLAVLAIFLSFSSSSTLERTSEKISASTHDIKESSQKISNAISIIERIEKGVNDVGNKFDAYKEAGYSQTYIETTLSTIGDNKIVNEIPEEFAFEFISNSTPRGCEVLLIATLSYRYSTPFTFGDTFGEGDHSYALGFLKAAEAAGFLKTKNNNHGKIAIIKINDIILKNIEEKVIEKNKESLDFFISDEISPESAKSLVYEDYINIFKYFNAIHDAKDTKIKSF